MDANGMRPEDVSSALFTVTEDLDLTYRGWIKGWRGIFLTSVAVPGELPADSKTWLRQQQRWQDGFPVRCSGCDMIFRFMQSPFWNSTPRRKIAS